MFGYHAVYEQSFSTAIRLARELGFDYVQFDLSVPTFYVTGLSRNEIKSIRSAADGEGVVVTFHAPGDFLSIGIDTPGVRDAVIEHFTRILDVANELGSHHVTFHLGGIPSFRAATKDVTDYATVHGQYYQTVISEDLGRLVDVAGSVLIAIENYRLKPLHLLALAPFLSASTPMRLCMDIAKLHTADKKLDLSDWAFFTANRSKVTELHLHNSAESSHQPLYEGHINLDEFREWITRDDIWKTIEVRPAEYAAKSLDWLRSRFDI
jgi:sugar phosphate isomerase/epimerase